MILKLKHKKPYQPRLKNIKQKTRKTKLFCVNLKIKQNKHKPQAQSTTQPPLSVWNNLIYSLLFLKTQATQ